MESTTVVSRSNLDGRIYRTHAINFANVNSSFRPVRGKAMAAKSGASRSCIFFLSLSSSNQLQNTIDQVSMFLFPAREKQPLLTPRGRIVQVLGLHLAYELTHSVKSLRMSSTSGCLLSGQLGQMVSKLGITTFVPARPSNNERS